MTTLPTTSAAVELATSILESRLGACVQILPQITSVFIWNGAIQSVSEQMLMIKTLPGMFDELRDFITANHKYSVPEIVGIETEHVSEPYLVWMKELLA